MDSFIPQIPPHPGKAEFEVLYKNFLLWNIEDFRKHALEYRCVMIQYLCLLKKPPVATDACELALLRLYGFMSVLKRTDTEVAQYTQHLIDSLVEKYEDLTDHNIDPIGF